MWAIPLALIAVAGGVIYSVNAPVAEKILGDTMMQKEGSAIDQEKDKAGMMEKEDATMEKTDDAMMEKNEGAMMDKGDEAMMEKGTYESYSPEKLALAENGKVLLFFHAPWCPICRSMEGEINANPEAIPGGVHILKIDYDTAIALRQKYGVTVQHTFVQVDAKGTSLSKWSDTTTLAKVLSRIQ